MVFILFSFKDSMAESNMAYQNSPATAGLHFKIHIPATLYLQIGTISEKKDEDSLDGHLISQSIPALQDNKSSIVKISGLVRKGGMIFLSSGNNKFTNDLHSKTGSYILSSP
jgi:hypothetical protein